MTLKKIEQMSAGNPILRPFEVKISSKVKIISEPRSMHTQHDEEGSDSLVCDVELETPIEKSKMEIMISSPIERKSRIATQKRLWFINATNLNHLIDSFGDQESDWVNKTIDLVTVEQDVFGSLKSVIYVKGAKSLA